MTTHITHPARRIVSLNGTDWKIGRGSAPTAWIPARVPGNAQEDMWRAGLKPDPYVGMNAESYRDLEGETWVYERRFDMDRSDRSTWTLLFEGVDYEADFILNGSDLGAHTGSCGEVSFDVTRLLRRRDNLLRVLIHPIVTAPRASRAVVDPLAPERHDGRWMAKPLVSFFWDFAPRLVPVGLWKDVSLVGTDDALLAAPRTDCVIAADHTNAHLSVHALLHLPRAKGVSLTFELRDREEIVSSATVPARPAGDDGDVCIHVDVPGPRLWWPNGSGEPFLYRGTLRVTRGGRTLDAMDFPVGIRTVTMVRTPRDQAAEIHIPAGPLADETTLVVNGRPIAYRGINMAPLDILFGRIDDERIETQLRLARDAHINLLRLWGGGPVNRRRFFEMADHYGIMLWQEFPIGCTDHEGNDAYRAVLGREVTSIVRSLRRHPSVVLWVGGNELFMPHSGMGPTDRVVRMVGSICYQEDPERLFIPTTPYPGSFHGPYTFDCYGQGGFGEAVDHVGFCNATPPGAYNECGVAGPAPASVIRRGAGETVPWPPRAEGAWQFHKAFGAWGAGTTWLTPELVERYFGPIERLEDLCRAGQFLQAIGMQYLLEELRRKWPDVPGTMPWCFNTPWTSFAGSFVVAYPDQPMPAYHALATAYAPCSISARLQSFVARPGEPVTAALFLVNDGEAAGAGRVVYEIGAVGGEPWSKGELPAPPVGSMERRALEMVSATPPPGFTGVARITLAWEHDGRREEGGAFIGITADRERSPCFRPLLALWEKDPSLRMDGME